MEVNVVALVSAAGGLCGILFGYLGYTKSKEKEVKQSGIESGQFKVDIDYIKRSSDCTLLEIKDLNRTIGIHADRLARVEESTKQAHHRIDELREGFGKDV